MTGITVGDGGTGVFVEGMGTAVGVSVGIGVCVSVGNGVWVGVAEGVTVEVAVGLSVAVSVGRIVGMVVGAGMSVETNSFCATSSATTVVGIGEASDVSSELFEAHPVINNAQTKRINCDR